MLLIVLFEIGSGNNLSQRFLICIEYVEKRGLEIKGARARQEQKLFFTTLHSPQFFVEHSKISMINFLVSICLFITLVPG